MSSELTHFSSPHSSVLLSAQSPLVMLRYLIHLVVCEWGEDPTLRLCMAEGTKMLSKQVLSTTLIPRQYAAQKIPYLYSEHKKLQLTAPVQSPNSRTSIQHFITTFQAETKFFKEDCGVIWNMWLVCCLLYCVNLFSFMAIRLFITILTAALNIMPYNCLNVPSGKQVSLMYLAIIQSPFELSQLLFLS